MLFTRVVTRRRLNRACTTNNTPWLVAQVIEPKEDEYVAAKPASGKADAVEA